MWLCEAICRCMWLYGLHGTVSGCGCMRLYGVLGCIGLYWAIWLYMGLYGAIYRAIWGLYGQICAMFIAALLEAR